jgi:hypothetical protein
MRHVFAPATTLGQAFHTCRCPPPPKGGTSALQALATDGVPVVVIWLDGPEDKIPRYVPGGYAHPKLKSRAVDAYLGAHADRRELLDSALGNQIIRVIEVLRATHIGNRPADEDEVVPVPQAYCEMRLERQGDDYIFKLAVD